MYFCKLFNWPIEEYISDRVCLSQHYFMNRYNCGLSDIERTAISFMLELIRLRDNYLEFPVIFILIILMSMVRSKDVPFAFRRRYGHGSNFG